MFATVGFHPQEAGLLDDEGRAGLEELARHPRVVAVGETGFDFYHDNWPHDVQEDVVPLPPRPGPPRRVCRWSSTPATRPSRRWRVLAEHAGGLTVILHCFSLPDRLDEVVERGYYISFAGNVTYKNAADSAGGRARPCPADLLLLETDAPWLTPVPLRGRPNRPALVANGLRVRGRAARGRPWTNWRRRWRSNVLRAFPAHRRRAERAERPPDRAAAAG